MLSENSTFHQSVNLSLNCRGTTRTAADGEKFGIRLLSPQELCMLLVDSVA